MNEESDNLNKISRSRTSWFSAAVGSPGWSLLDALGQGLLLHSLSSIQFSRCFSTSLLTLFPSRPPTFLAQPPHPWPPKYLKLAAFWALVLTARWLLILFLNLGQESSCHTCRSPQRPPRVGTGPFNQITDQVRNNTCSRKAQTAAHRCYLDPAGHKVVRSGEYELLGTGCFWGSQNHLPGSSSIWTGQNELLFGGSRGIHCCDYLDLLSCLLVSHNLQDTTWRLLS